MPTDKLINVVIQSLLLFPKSMGLKRAHEDIYMKHVLSILSFLILLTTVTTGYSQHRARTTGKTNCEKIMTGIGLNRKFDKIGTFNSTFATKSEKMNHIKGSGTYTKARGYFRKFTVIFADSNIVERAVS